VPVHQHQAELPLLAVAAAVFHHELLLLSIRVTKSHTKLHAALDSKVNWFSDGI
jgi:hypothetical protein